MRRCFTVVVAMVGLSLFFTGRSYAQGSLPPLAGSVYGAQAEGNPPTLSVGLGWPSFYTRFDFRSMGRFTLGLQGDLYYGMPVWGWASGFGFGFSVPMRIQLLQRQKWALGLMLRPGMYLGFSNRWYWNWYWDEDMTVVGPFFGLGLVASVTPLRFLNVFFGINNTLHVLVVVPEHHDSVADVFVPIMFFGGVELQVHRRIAVFSSLALGPTVGSYYSHCHNWINDGRYRVCTDWHDDVGAEFTFQFYTGASFTF